jgi:hypothetical protein
MRATRRPFSTTDSRRRRSRLAGVARGSFEPQLDPTPVHAQRNAAALRRDIVESSNAAGGRRVAVRNRGRSSGFGSVGPAFPATLRCTCANETPSSGMRAGAVVAALIRGGARRASELAPVTAARPRRSCTAFPCRASWVRRATSTTSGRRAPRLRPEYTGGSNGGRLPPVASWRMTAREAPEEASPALTLSPSVPYIPDFPRDDRAGLRTRRWRRPRVTTVAGQRAPCRSLLGSPSLAGASPST